MNEKYEFHEVANIFPLIEGTDFESLTADIKKNGLKESIWLHENKIIDGRNRYRACLESGVAPMFRNWDGKGSLTDFVVSLNLMRRHLSIEQRTASALKAKPFYVNEAKVRMIATQNNINGIHKALSAPQIVAEQEGGEAADKVAKVFGTNKLYLRELELVHLSSPETFEAIASGKKKMAIYLKERKIEVRKEKIAAQVEEIKKLPKIENKKYGVIVIDPPWQFAGEYDPEGWRGPGDYPTMSMEEIANIKLPTDDNCVIFLWAVDTYLKETLEIISKWGFERKNTIIWVKDKFGLGKWLRNQHEYCFVCTRGKPMFQGEATSTVLHADRHAHSEKPAEFYTLVEKICPDPRRLDYFARKKRDGWDVYGDEIQAETPASGLQDGNFQGKAGC